MAKYDGLIIPRSYNDYINKSDPLGVSQALQLTGVMDDTPTAQSTKPAKSGGIYSAIEAKNPVDTVALNNMNSVTSNAVAGAISLSDIEIECGFYFGSQKYHKSFVFTNITLVANTVITIRNNFEIPYNKTVAAKGFCVSADAWSNSVEVFILSDGTLAVASKLGGSGFAIVIEIEYVK